MKEWKMRMQLFFPASAPRTPALHDKITNSAAAYTNSVTASSCIVIFVVHP
jgi:hypothetical protein